MRAKKYFQTMPKVAKVIFSLNYSKFPEAYAFSKMQNSVSLGDYSILTYMHGKGVTKYGNDNVKDWVELMRYFLIDKFSITQDTFQRGYALYGVNLSTYQPGSERFGPFMFSDFHYSGNFVSINLEKLREKILSTPVDYDYFGLEGYWGKLCDISAAFCAHLSSTHIKNHYLEAYPSTLYR
jgi:hypothetical protein